jgi:hypothetical protein
VTTVPPGAQVEWDEVPLVDLGEQFDVVPESEPWTPHARHWWRRSRPIALLLLVLILAGGSASAVPAVVPLSRVPVGMDVMALVDGPDVYVYDIEHGHNQLAAYRIDDGRALWSVQASELATETTLLLAHGVLVVSMIDVSTSGPHTEAFDAATGAHLWSSAKGMASLTSSGDILLQHVIALTPDAETDASFEVRDPRTGAVRWSEDDHAGCLDELAVDPDGKDTGVMELCPDTSVLRRRDLGTGELDPVRQVPLAAPAGAGDLPVEDRFFRQQLIVMSGVVLVAHANVPTPTVDAYDAVTLAPLWGGLPLIDGQYMEPCGDELCLAGEFGGIRVIDLRTGLRVRTDASAGSRIAPGQLVLVRRTGSGRLMPSPISSIAPGEQAGFTDAAGETLWLQRWKPGAGDDPAGSDVIDVMHGVSHDQCAAWGRVMVCGVNAHHLSLWRLP